MGCQRNRLWARMSLVGLSSFLSFVLQAAEVRISVVDATSRKPLSSVDVVSLSGDILGDKRGAEDEDGVFPLQVIQNGFMVRGPGYISIAFVPGQGKRITGKSLTIALPRLGAFHGKVVDSETFSPVPEASVHLRDGRKKRVSEGQTDTRGEFSLAPKEVGVVVRHGGESLEKLVNNMTLTLEIAATGYTPPTSHSMQEVKLEDINRRKQVILLEREERLSGRVIDSDGKPLRGARVAWVSQSIKGVSSSITEVSGTMSGEEGLFIWTVPRTTCKTLLSASQPGFGPGWTCVGRCTRRGEGPTIIRLRPAGRLRVAVKDESGMALARVAVMLLPLDVPPRWHLLSRPVLAELYGRRPPWVGSTGGDGTLVLEGLPTGRFTIRLRGGPFVSPPAMEKEVVVERDSSWEGTLIRGRCVTLKVVTEDGAVVRGARVRFLAEQESVFFGILGRDSKRVALVPIGALFTRDAPGEHDHRKEGGILEC